MPLVGPWVRGGRKIDLGAAGTYFVSEARGNSGKRHQMGSITRSVFVIILCASACHVDAAPLVFSMTAFNSALEVSLLGFKSGNDVSSFIAFQSTGGNPGDSLRAFTSIAGDPPAVDSWTLSAFVFKNKVATPSIVPIANVSFSQDVKLVEGSAQGIETGLLLRQGGVVFVNRWALGTEPQWTTRSRNGLAAEDFVALVPSAGGDGFDGNVLPNFSQAGSPITFGLYIRHSAAALPSSSYALDNWHAQVNFVPEPSSLVIAALALAALRRRK
jgi:hypothetical protein